MRRSPHTLAFMTEARPDPLLDAVPIGPHTAHNRFWQVPQCNGMGYRDPSMLAAMRRIKAEGGPSSEVTPFIEGRIPPVATEVTNTREAIPAVRSEERAALGGGGGGSASLPCAGPSGPMASNVMESLMWPSSGNSLGTPRERPKRTM